MKPASGLLVAFMHFKGRGRASGLGSLGREEGAEEVRKGRAEADYWGDCFTEKWEER